MHPLSCCDTMPLSCRVSTIVTPFLPDYQGTLLTSWSVDWTLQCVSSLAHTRSTTACHTCCMRNCTGSTSQTVSTTNWESQCIAICRTRPQSTWSTVVHQSQTFPADVITWPMPDRTTLPAQHFRSSGLLCRWSDGLGLELTTGQSPRLGAHQHSFRQSLKTNLFRRYQSHRLERVVPTGPITCSSCWLV